MDHRETERETSYISLHSSKLATTVAAGARSQEHNPDLLHDWRESPSTSQGTHEQAGSSATEQRPKPRHSDIGCGHPKPQLRAVTNVHSFADMASVDIMVNGRSPADQTEKVYSIENWIEIHSPIITPDSVCPLFLKKYIQVSPLY